MNQIGLTPTAGISVGEQIPISITVVDPGTGGPVYNNIPGGTAVFTSATFNGASAIGLFQSITVTPGSSIVLSSGTPQTAFGFTLSLTGAMNGAVATGAIPASLDPVDFSGGTFTVEEVYEDDQSFSGTIHGVGGVNITPVPEPASWLLLGAGFLGALWQTARGRRSVRKH